MKVEIIPSAKCDVCGSYQVIITPDGKECDECSRHIPATITNNSKNEKLSLGLDISEDVEDLKLKIITEI